jgi:TRAP-type C4-dicarboxylate transport system substrate-binding protein
MLLGVNMRRRKFIGAVAGTSIATLSGCTGDSDSESDGGSNGSDGGSNGSDGNSDGSTETINLRVGSFAPEDSFYITRFSYPIWVEKVNSKLDEYEIEPEFLGAGSVGGPGELYDLAAEGTVDMAVDLPAYQGGRMPLSLLASVPGLFPATTEGHSSAAQALHEMATPGGESEILYNEFDNIGIRPIMSYTAAPSQLHLKKRISSVSELEDLRVQASGSQEQVANRLGMSGAQIAHPDIHSALQSGTIDGLFTPLAATYANSWYDQIHYATTNLNLGGFHIGWVMGQDTFGDLPSAVSEAIAAAGTETVAEYASNIQQGIEDVLLASENVVQEEPVDKGNQYLIYETEASEDIHNTIEPVIDSWIESQGDVPAQEAIDTYLSLQEEYRG